MGLDIFIRTDNNDQIFTAHYDEARHDHLKKHSLSRTFCNLMCRQNVINGEPELDQIGRITSVDISPIYAMETYAGDNSEELQFFLETVESETERQQILEQARQNRQKLSGNIDKILSTIDALIDRLSSVENLPELLNDHGHDTLDYKNYFTDFNKDKGQGYVNNNFGQDLRNFKRFLEYAKERGTTTVYFNYG
jgi:predicted ribosome quality control (RQC) complex YloA/Tae2 family protein